MTLDVLILRLTLDAGRDGLLEPEKFNLFKFRPPGSMRERFHFFVAEGSSCREACVVADHGIADDKGGEEPDAICGETTAKQVDAGGAMARNAGHFLQDGGGILFCEVVEGEAAEDQIGSFFTEGELAGIGLDKEHFLIR